VKLAVVILLEMWLSFSPGWQLDCPIFLGQSKSKWLTCFQLCAGALRGEIGSGNFVRNVAIFFARLATGLSNLTACSALSVY